MKDAIPYPTLAVNAHGHLYWDWRLWLERLPPIKGGEYLNGEALDGLWNRLDEQARAQAASHPDGPAGYLKSLNPVWRIPQTTKAGAALPTLSADDVGALFGIELETATPAEPPPAAPAPRAARQKATKKKPVKAVRGKKRRAGRTHASGSGRRSRPA